MQAVLGAGPRLQALDAAGNVQVAALQPQEHAAQTGLLVLEVQVLHTPES